jgi:hypothetical protein
MENFKFIFILMLFSGLFISCEDKTEIDKEKPEIDLSYSKAFPLNCDTLYFGESFNLNMLFTDNAELGSYSASIHHNFDHHSHSTEVTDCELSPKKDPVNPLTFIDDFSIPEGLSEYETDVSVAIPSGDSEGQFDEGDYHFFISLTDKEGWSAQKGLSIKMLYRE